ncbi:MAG TPA: hypothetical protein PK228_11230 [Saprospiraceae bacterium]|nr:hypothetical protein [Saprospiraceae bacterium]
MLRQKGSFTFFGYPSEGILPHFFPNPLYMRLMCFVFVLLFSAVAAIGQTAVARTPAKVLDFGQLYSTFNWEAPVITELKANLGDALAAKVINASTETAWPTGIASLDSRTQNRSQMAAYTVYYLTTVGENKAVLVVPAAENRAMPANMQSAGDIYFLVTRTAVEFKSAAAPVASAAAPTGSFATQINEITEDFGNGFVNLTNDLLDEDEDAMILIYGSRVSLEGATELYFYEDLYAAATTFHAAFPGSTDPAVALKSYRELVRKIESLQLTCCSLSNSEEQVDGNRHGQVFTAYDPKGNLNIDYQNMAIEVRIEQGETFDKDGHVVSNWIPVLDIYEHE